MKSFAEYVQEVQQLKEMNSDAALREKASSSGIEYSKLKKVFEKGMAGTSKRKYPFETFLGSSS